MSRISKKDHMQGVSVAGSEFMSGYEDGYNDGYTAAIDEIEKAAHTLCNIRQVLERLKEMRSC